MKKMHFVLTAAAIAVFGVAYTVSAASAPGAADMSFFVTSVGAGKGGNLGGLAGADKHCQDLAAAVGSKKTWHAYLSATAEGGKKAVLARSRIGSGPWKNVKGVVIAKSVADLHSDKNNLTKETQLTEKGDIHKGVGDTPTEHDILTGASPDGGLFPGDADTTCRNWTSDGAGSAQVGHFDRKGGGLAPTSWNSSHASSGCSQPNLVATGGAGYFYCFATK